MKYPVITGMVQGKKGPSVPGHPSAPAHSFIRPTRRAKGQYLEGKQRGWDKLSSTHSSLSVNCTEIATRLIVSVKMRLYCLSIHPSINSGNLFINGYYRWQSLVMKRSCGAGIYIRSPLVTSQLIRGYNDLGQLCPLSSLIPRNFSSTLQVTSALTNRICLHYSVRGRVHALNYKRVQKSDNIGHLQLSLY